MVLWCSAVVTTTYSGISTEHSLEVLAVRLPCNGFSDILGPKIPCGLSLIDLYLFFSTIMIFFQDPTG